MSTPIMFNSIEDRYKSATFNFPLQSGSLEFRLDEPLNHSDRVIIDKEILGNLGDPRNVTEVFLFRQTLETGAWQGALWTKERNPWINGSFSRGGGVIRGRVQGYIEDFVAILIGEIGGTRMEFQVLREDLPSELNKLDIRDALPERELVAGMMKAPDLQNLRVNLDVAGWLHAQRNLWRAKKDSDPAVAKISQKPKDWIDLSGKKVLIIDDEQILVETISNHIEHSGGMGIAAHRFSDGGMLAAVESGLRLEPDFVILDRQFLGYEELEEPIFNLVKNYGRSAPRSHILLFTGQLKGARKVASQHGFGFLEKPAIIAQLFKWLANPVPAEKNGFDVATQQAQQLFSVQVKMEQIIKRANTVLEDLCEHHGLYGAMWFIEKSPGRYELRANSSKFENVVPESTVEKLEKSIVGNAMSGGKSHYGALPLHDPIAQFSMSLLDFPRQAYYFIYPLTYEATSNRVVVFLADHRISPEVRDDISSRRNHFELMIENIEQAAEIDEISASAQLGRLALGCMHEMRNKLSQMFAIADNPQFSDSEKLEFMRAEHFRGLQALAKGQLLNYSTTRSLELDLVESIDRICRDMRGYIRDKHDKVNVIIEFDRASAKGIVLSIDPTPFERAVVNIIDNASTFLLDLPVKKIFVSVRRDQADAERPIKITISDTGPGVSIHNRQKLFLPRSTTKTREQEGVGLGLYISRSLIEAIGGSLEYIEKPILAGATFEISLPERIG
ncbi:MAG: hypothetical protein COB08_004305 [Rhodobacteraceae bacterium]|nr:hypothetical protein [Paracoccaceae bacterium]